MYIDFHKYNYNLVDPNERQAYESRDKEAYKVVLRKWLEDNIEQFVSRKWEIDEIHYLAEISDFIRLLREGEQLYELGFFTSCIALIGVSAEDFTKYLAVKLGKPQYESQTQYNRLENLKNDGLLPQATFQLLDDIRKVRNDCLHYNQNFKQKSETQLKQEAILVLNNLKMTLKNMLGIGNNFSLSGFTDIISEIGSELNAKNKEEMAAKVKNAVSHLLNIPIAFDPKENVRVRYGLFKIEEIDFDFHETTFADLSNGFPVILELPDEKKKIFTENHLKEGQTVFALIYSKIDQNGLTAVWNILDIKK